MVFLKLLLSISLFGCLAKAEGVLGVTPSFELSGQRTDKIYLDIYENIYKNLYINPYIEIINNRNYQQKYIKIDFNKHYNTINLGVGLSNTYNNYGNQQEIRVNAILKLW